MFVITIYRPKLVHTYATKGFCPSNVIYFHGGYLLEDKQLHTFSMAQVDLVPLHNVKYYSLSEK